MALAKFAYGALSVACSTLSTAADLELQSQHAKDALLPSAHLQYWPLEGVRPKIRLLTIIPGRECDSVHYKLSTEQLEVAPQYEALSYVWGSSQDNLTRYLDLWRNDSDYRWTDALCINQSDGAKHTRAIRSMSDCHESSTHEQERGHMSKRLETDALEDACRVLLDNYQWRKMPTHSIFLKLHIWMTGRIERALSSVHLQLPRPLKQPTPQMLLASWLILFLTVATHHQRLPEGVYKSTDLLIGLCTALVIGIAEGLNITSMILTDVPWCLTICMSISSIWGGIFQVRPRGVRQLRRLEKQKGDEKMEKEMC